VIVASARGGRWTNAATASVLAAVLALALGCGDGSSQAPSTTAPGPPPPGEASGDASSAPPRPGDGAGGVVLSELGSFESPVYVSQPPVGDDEHLYVVEQCGRVQRIGLDGGDARTFLDLTDQVACGGEQGLLSVAFAPDYADSGRLYVDYTDRDGDTRVVEYRRSTTGPATADADSARAVLSVDQPYANHNGGLLLFGPDDRLYVGLGDGGGAGDPQRNGQDLSTLLGKILRIDPRRSGGDPYSVPADNPFVDRPGARPEILASGLRNPWRFSFDPRTRALWIGDVGQDALEEIDAAAFGELESGLNFGWSAFEGTERFNDDQSAADARRPVLEYPLDEACAVTGGYVVRDPELPTLYGRYLYGDFCEGQLRSFTADVDGGAGDDRELGVRVPSLSSFGTDAAGRVYATSLEGPVYRLDPRG
jgi:glucose/arabinose dehydrogenase